MIEYWLVATPAKVIENVIIAYPNSVNPIHILHARSLVRAFQRS